MAEKAKIQMEYPMHCSPKVLYMRLATPAGLEEWFANKVNYENTIYSFSWYEETRRAKVVASKDLKFIRYKWLDDEDPLSYFEFKISIDELTGDLSLVIVDYVNEGEQKEYMKLWDKLINELKHVLGSNG